MNEFEKLCKEYAKRFGEAYGVSPVDSRPISEHVELLKEALETGVPIPDNNEELPEWL
jgi:hypothetical protein